MVSLIYSIKDHGSVRFRIKEKVQAHVYLLSRCSIQLLQPHAGGCHTLPISRPLHAESLVEHQGPQSIAENPISRSSFSARIVNSAVKTTIHIASKVFHTSKQSMCFKKLREQETGQSVTSSQTT